MPSRNEGIPPHPNIRWARPAVGNGESTPGLIALRSGLQIIRVREDFSLERDTYKGDDQRSAFVYGLPEQPDWSARTVPGIQFEFDQGDMINVIAEQAAVLLTRVEDFFGIDTARPLGEKYFPLIQRIFAVYNPNFIDPHALSKILQGRLVRIQEGLRDDMGFDIARLQSVGIESVQSERLQRIGLDHSTGLSDLALRINPPTEGPSASEA